MESSYQYHFGGGLDWGATGGQSLITESGTHQKSAISVQEYAYNEDANSSFRPYMEDTYCAVDNFAGDTTCGIFGIFDGHGGKTVSEYIAERVPEEFKKQILINKPTDLVQIFEDVFLKIDQELKMMDSDNTGSTAVVAIARMESGHRVFYLGNAGDTRAVISRNGVAERMTFDHKCDEITEIDRIKLGGGIILEGRVGGTLAVTRAFGDYALKNDGVIVNPYVRKHFIRPFDKYLIIASDGVWDVLSDQDAVDLCKDDLDTNEISKEIIKQSLEMGSRDNISCLVIKI